METQDQLQLQSKNQRRDIMLTLMKSPTDVTHVGEILSKSATLMLTLQSTQVRCHFLATAVGKDSELENH